MLQWWEKLEDLVYIHYSQLWPRARCKHQMQVSVFNFSPQPSYFIVMIATIMTVRLAFTAIAIRTDIFPFVSSRERLFCFIMHNESSSVFLIIPGC